MAPLHTAVQPSIWTKAVPVTYFVVYSLGYTNVDGTQLIEDCLFIDNHAGGGLGNGGAFCLNAGGNATLRNCQFIGNSATHGGAIFVEEGEIVIEGCDFIGNSAIFDGGAITDFHNGVMHSDPDSQTLIRDCTFYGNSANYSGIVGNGGALSLDSDSIVRNCIFADNFAVKGGAINSDDSDTEPIRVENCTFEANNAFQYGRDIYNTQGSLIIVNSILNGATSVAGIYNVGSTTVSYSNVRGSGGSGIMSWNSSFGTDGLGNIDSDPDFVLTPDDGGDGWADDTSTTGVDESANNDYGILSLLPTSPCIDAGDGSVAPTFDFYGSSRHDDPVTTPNTGNPTPDYTDMGAIEFLPGDADGDGWVGQDDLDIVLLNWGQTVGDREMGDLDGDGSVGQSDYDLVLAAWGQGDGP